MTKRNLVLSSAIAALVSGGFAANSMSAFAEEPAAKSETPAAKHDCKSHTKGKHCDCKKKNCKGDHCKATKDGCDGKDGCHTTEAKPAAAAGATEASHEAK